MKVILLQDVAKVGRRFEVAEVPDGYAMNMLIPKGLAEAATPENLKKLKALTAKATAAGEATSAQFTEATTALKDSVILVKVELNEQGHMFEALKPVAVVEAAQAMGASIVESQVMFDMPIKEAGEHIIELQEGDEKVKVTINVVSA